MIFFNCILVKMWITRRTCQLSVCSSWIRPWFLIQGLQGAPKISWSINKNDFHKSGKSTSRISSSPVPSFSVPNMPDYLNFPVGSFMPSREVVIWFNIPSEKHHFWQFNTVVNTKRNQHRLFTPASGEGREWEVRNYPWITDGIVRGKRASSEL